MAYVASRAIAGRPPARKLGYPAGVAVDGAGNVFVSMAFFTMGNGNVVLRLDAKTGILSLAAGDGTSGFSGDNGPAISAQLGGGLEEGGPGGLAADSDGNLYIADTSNH